MESFIGLDPEAGDHDLQELRCLHELARQLLPLRTPREVARDGLLCIAGITGVGAGVVLWRPGEGGAFHVLSHFGLEPGRLKQRYTINVRAQSYLGDVGPVTGEAARRRTLGRALMRSLRALEERMGEAWIVPLHGERRLRGVLMLGPSLVTQELLPRPGWATDLAEILRLALLGREVAADGGARARPRALRDTRGRGPEARPATVGRVDEPAGTSGRSIAARLRALRRRQPGTQELVGESAAILALLEDIVSLAGTDYTVLLHGETGTGKELAAQLLHRLSLRAAGVFEAVDCSSIPQELIESELFGHVKGAFTGASRDFRGAFERADGGTLLLDEIGDMDLRSQTRLLRVLQEGSVRRLGGDRAVPVDVRVIAATNQDLAALVRAGRFREDLYYRIQVCPLRIPSLRERGDDRLVLFEHWMQHLAAELSRKPRTLSPQARQRLRAEAFPGNVRQLQNVVRRLLVARNARGPIEETELQTVLAESASLPRNPQGVGALAASGTPGTPGFTAPVGAGAPAADSAPRRPDAAGAPEPALDAGAPVRAPFVPSEPFSGSGALQLPAVRGAEPATQAYQGPPVEDVGAWVLQTLREHRFNLLAAARALQRLRRQGATRAQVPVFDRGALDSYLCGEFFRRLVAQAYQLDAVIAGLAGQADLVPRVRRKVRAFLRPIRTQRRLDRRAAGGLLRDGYRRIPERYHVDIEQAIEALRRRRWRLQ
jgi:transcriptional regulator with GAF, ATPase, and Fis domain